MCKKIGIAAVAVVAGLIVLNHTKLGGWAKHTFHNIKERVVTSVVKPEDEIRNLKDKLNDFEPRIHEQINKMAEVKADQMKLEKQITEQTARLEKQWDKILTLKKGLETIKVKGGNTTTVAASKLDSEFRSYQAGEESLKVKQVMLDRSKEKFAAAETKLTNMQAMKVKLEADLAQLEVRLEVARAKEAQDRDAFDDEDLGDIKADFAKLEERINKMEITRDLEAQFLPVTTTEGPPKKAPVSVDNLLKEIEEHSPGGKSAGKVASDKD
jgi:chromosome segregation ATPase